MRRKSCCLMLSLCLTLSLIGVAGGEAEKKKEEAPKPITITADRLEANRKLRTVNYLDNVVVKKENLTIYARKIEFLFDEKMEEIQKITAEGSVRVLDADKSATADKAVYLNDQDILILTGNPKVWQGDNVIAGTKMTLLRKEDRSIVEGGGKERVTSVFYPNKGKGKSPSPEGLFGPGKTEEEKPGKTKGGQ
jgi:lipopolysaccharide export system protein LptA